MLTEAEVDVRDGPCAGGLRCSGTLFGPTAAAEGRGGSPLTPGSDRGCAVAGEDWWDVVGRGGSGARIFRRRLEPGAIEKAGIFGDDKGEGDGETASSGAASEIRLARDGN